jgi:hypothetical protein
MHYFSVCVCPNPPFEDAVSCDVCTDYFGVDSVGDGVYITKFGRS